MALAVARIDQNNGRFQASWNWASFLFGAIWYLVKGMWAKALIFIFVGTFIGIITYGIRFLVLWIYFGMAGNYDLYLKERRGTQLW